MRKIPLFVALILAAAVLLAGAAPVNAQGGRTYVVQVGDTLFSIAGRFNVSISELATINKVYDVNHVSVGQVLILPNPLPTGSVQVLPVAGQAAAPSTGPGSTTSTGTSPIYTPPVVIYSPGTTITTVTTYTSYVVRTGDNLSAIAARFGTTPQAILNANFIGDANLVYVGQLLTIPRTSTSVVQPRVVSRPVVSGRFYIVQPGDNLFSIGARFGRDAWSIAKRNGILDLNAIFVGQPLVIP